MVICVEKISKKIIYISGKILNPNRLNGNIPGTNFLKNLNIKIIYLLNIFPLQGEGNKRVKRSPAGEAKKRVNREGNKRVKRSPAGEGKKRVNSSRGF